MRILLLTLFTSCSFFNNKEHLTHYYQLQNYDDQFIKSVAKTRDTLWVVDRDFSSERSFTSSEIQSMKNNDRNKIFSYMSVGEAESYRPYFSKIPKDLLDKENPNWPGAFDIKFWDEKWDEILYRAEDSYLSKIINIGFDGVYLDVVDAYQRQDDRRKYASAMAKLIISISKSAKSKNPSFKIYLQNGSEIINDLDKDLAEIFIASIDGLSVEGYFFDYSDAQKPIVSDWFKSLEVVYKKYLTFNKDVLLIEYVEDKALQQKFIDYCQANKVSYLITDRLLKGKFFINN